MRMMHSRKIVNYKKDTNRQETLGIQNSLNPAIPKILFKKHSVQRLYLLNRYLQRVIR